ncbi:DUF4153 domain-containing protein [Leptospira sp. 96542]|nr:DUF4153 domain-containing protein [Leptospira sp. 96542]
MLEPRREITDLTLKLEKEFRQNPKTFRENFHLNSLGESLPMDLYQFWKIRLAFEPTKSNQTTIKSYFVLFSACLFAGILIKLPYILPNLSKDIYYTKFFPFPILIGFLFYCIYLFKTPVDKIYKILVFFIFSFLFVCFLPDWHNKNLYSGIKLSDTNFLTVIHIPIFILTILGLAYPNQKQNQTNPRQINYIHFIAEVIVFTAIILLAGILLTFITFALFKTIGINIEKFYMDWMVVWGLVSSPIVAAHFVHNHTLEKFNISQLVSKIFSPIVFFTLLGYLYFTVLNLDHLFSDRQTLLTFNFMLAALFAIITFQFSCLDKNQFFMSFFLIGLLLLGMTINTLGLFAIYKRLSEFGMTPNRISVIGSNLCFFISLLFLTYYLIQTLRKKYDLEVSLHRFAKSLIIFPIWTALVAFIFPIIFQFK